MVNETEGIGKSISLRWLIERTCTRGMISWPRKQEVSRARDIERTSLDSSGGEKLHQESRERNCSRYFNDILKVSNTLGANHEVNSIASGFLVVSKRCQNGKWLLRQTPRCHFILVEIPRVPKDASRGSEKKGGILIIKETEKASLERFRINVRTKALNSEPMVT